MMNARIDSLQSITESVLSSANGFDSRLNRHSKQWRAIQEQTAKATESKLDEMQRHITSMDSKLKEVQRRTDGRMRRHSENTQSQSVEILAQIAALTQQMGVLQQEFAVLKESENKDGDEEVQEQPEAEKLRKWMKDEVKLPRYFNVLRDNGFDNLESLQDLTDWDLKEMGIDKMGHRRRIMRNVNMLRAGSNVLIPMQSAPQQQVPVAPAAAYDFGAAKPRSAKVDVEGPNVVDTGH